jgi:hypothetical protein
MASAGHPLVRIVADALLCLPLVVRSDIRAERPLYVNLPARGTMERS